MRKTALRAVVIFLIPALLVSVFAFSILSGKKANTGNIIANKDIKIVETEEMRAIWVPYFSLCMDKGSTEADFEKKFDDIIRKSAESGLNTLIVQVRPFCDALDKSQYFPYSHVLGKEQGEDPGYDALEYMVKACHSAGMKIHAWVNPLRVTAKGTPDKLSKNNPASKWEDKDYVASCDGSKYLNPAYSEVRKLIIDGVREIAENYDVDGIQFDDYFYPTTEDTFDKTAYTAYTESLDDDSQALTLMEWRTSNINMLISGVYSAVHSVKKDIMFGIAPQGNISNNESLCADVKSWCSISGYVDYICPQIYFSMKHLLMPFENTAAQWRDMVKGKNVKLYLGLALYKAGSDDDDGTWKVSDTIIKQQIEISRSLKTSGFMLYSYEYLDCKQTEREVENAMAVLNS